MNALAGVRRHPGPRKRARELVERPASPRTPHEAWRTRSAIASRAPAQASKPSRLNDPPGLTQSLALRGLLRAPRKREGRQDGWPSGVEGWLRPAARASPQGQGRPSLRPPPSAAGAGAGQAGAGSNQAESGSIPVGIRGSKIAAFGRAAPGLFQASGGQGASATRPKRLVFSVKPLICRQKEDCGAFGAKSSDNYATRSGKRSLNPTL
jgi:hypothetical protein